MSEWHGGFDLIAILATDACSLQNVGFLEFCEDMLYGSFGNSDLSCNFAEGDGGVLRQHHKYVGVVGEERPAWLI